jgi:hypothetical protein
MTYTGANRAARRKLIPDRWLDADTLLAWCARAMTINKSVLTERRELQHDLVECYVSLDERPDDDKYFVDAFDNRWIELIQKFHTFLSDRTTAEHKPGNQRQGAEETVRTDNNLSRAWDTALQAAVRKLRSDEDVIDRTTLEEGLTWA